MRCATAGCVVLWARGGCGGPGGVPRGAVEGRVTLDGAMIETGSITFVPTGGTKGPVSGTAITDGHYRLSAADGPVVGSHRVEIYAPRKTGRKVPAPMGNPGEMTDEIVEVFPPQYNTRSILERDVKSGKNTLDFELDRK